MCAKENPHQRRPVLGAVEKSLNSSITSSLTSDPAPPSGARECASPAQRDIPSIVTRPLIANIAWIMPPRCFRLVLLRSNVKQLRSVRISGMGFFGTLFRHKPSFLQKLLTSHQNLPPHLAKVLS